MSEQIQEMFGRFIEDAVERAVAAQMIKTAEQAEKRAEVAVAAGLATMNEAFDRTSADIQKRIQGMIDQGVRTMTAETERMMERNSQRMQEACQKTMEDAPVTIQETLMQMIQENEALFHRRAEEWMSQFRAEQAADMSMVLQAQFEAVRRSMLEEIAQSAKAITDRHLFDFRSDFQNHISRTFQHAAEKLTAPVMRQ